MKSSCPITGSSLQVQLLAHLQCFVPIPASSRATVTFRVHCSFCGWEHTFLVFLPQATAPGEGTNLAGLPQQLFSYPSLSDTTKVFWKAGIMWFCSQILNIHTWVLLNRTEQMGATANSFSSSLGRADSSPLNPRL